MPLETRANWSDWRTICAGLKVSVTITVFSSGAGVSAVTEPTLIPAFLTQAPVFRSPMLGKCTRTEIP